MKYDTDEMLIKEALNKINTPEYDFEREVLAKTRVKQLSVVARRKFNRGLIATVVIILSGTVVASTLPGMDRLLSIIGPELGKLLQPIQTEQKEQREERESTQGIVDQGIEIKPLGVVNDDDMMIIYLAIQDLTQNRIGESLSLQDYFVEGGIMNNAQLVDYDAERKVAIVQITMQGGNELNNKSTEVKINSLLMDKKEIDMPISINLEDVLQAQDGESVWMTSKDTQGGGGSGDMWDMLDHAGKIKLLKPNQMQIEIPKIEGITITNMGFIDGKLHIQTTWEENDRNRHGYFYLTDKQGNKLKIKENNFYFGVDANNEIQFGNKYVEYILEISQEEIAQTELMAYFAEDGQVIEGEWKLELYLDAVGDIIKIPCDIEAEGWNIKEASVSPLGVTLKGRGTGKVDKAVACSILTKAGNTIEFDSTTISNQAGEITMKFGVEVPLDVREIASIQIGENIIDHLR